MKSKCGISGCTGRVVSKGLCDKHRKRVERHGHTDQTRPEDWGNREKHPLYHSWKWMTKYKGIKPINSRWEDFWQFAQDVGERPTPKHRLYKLDESLPYGPDNFYWREVLENVSKALYAQLWREQNPDKTRDIDLKRRFGITLDQFNEMYEVQNHRCAICGEKEFAKVNGKIRNLAVDHCHFTGIIRGLLCTNCNKVLGHAKDSIEVLEKAISYLRG